VEKGIGFGNQLKFQSWLSCFLAVRKSFNYSEIVPSRVTLRIRGVWYEELGL